MTFCWMLQCSCINPTPILNFHRTTHCSHLVTDVMIGHTYSMQQCLYTKQFQRNGGRKMSKISESKILPSTTFGFCTMVTNSFGQCCTDLLPFIWNLADHYAQTMFGFSLDENVPSVFGNPATCQQAANYRILWGQKYNENHQRILTCIFEGMISNGQSSFNTTWLPLSWIWILLLEHQNRYTPRTSQPFQFSNSMPSPTTHATPIQFSQLEQPSCSSNPSKLGEYNVPGPSLHLDSVLTPFSHLLKGSH